jgi:hypothetical protein
MDHAQEIFKQAVEKAGESRKDVKLWGIDTLDKSTRHAKVTVQSQDGEEFELFFTVGANDEVTIKGPINWRVPACILTADNIESAIKDAIQWKLGTARPFDSE